MPQAILPAMIGVAPELMVATPLAALGPIVWAATGLVVLFLALHITRMGAGKPLEPKRERPLRDAA
jgi:hypothetical protein